MLNALDDIGVLCLHFKYSVDSMQYLPSGSVLVPVWVEIVCCVVLILVKFHYSKSSDSSKTKKKEAAKTKPIEGESDSEFGFNHVQSKPPNSTSSE